MSFGFAFFVLLTAGLVFFNEELTEIAKKCWSTKWVRHSGLMFFIGFYSYAYQSYVGSFLDYCADFLKDSSIEIAKIIPFSSYKLTIALSLTLIITTTILSALLLGAYYLYKKKKFSESNSLIWVIWLITFSLLITELN